MVHSVVGEDGVKKGRSGVRVVSEYEMEVYERGIRKKGEKKIQSTNTSLLFHLRLRWAHHSFLCVSLSLSLLLAGSVSCQPSLPAQVSCQELLGFNSEICRDLSSIAGVTVAVEGAVEHVWRNRDVNFSGGTSINLFIYLSIYPSISPFALKFCRLSSVFLFVFHF